MVTWNLGAGPRRIFTKKALQLGTDVVQKPIQIIVNRSGRKTLIVVNGTEIISGHALGTSSEMKLSPILYIGGHNMYNFSTLPHDLPLHSGFQGCIFDVQIKSEQHSSHLHARDSIHGRSVSQCGSRECQRNTCHNGGACINTGPSFACICASKWYGPQCTEIQSYCDWQRFASV